MSVCGKSYRSLIQVSIDIAWVLTWASFDIVQQWKCHLIIMTFVTFCYRSLSRPHFVCFVLFDFSCPLFRDAYMLLKVIHTFYNCIEHIWYVTGYLVQSFTNCCLTTGLTNQMSWCWGLYLIQCLDVISKRQEELFSDDWNFRVFWINLP